VQAPGESLLTVDLDALAANFAVVRAQAEGAETAPVLKADGYGLGVGPVGRRLWAEGARSFFVARLSEAEALRRELSDRPAAVYVLDGAGAGSAARFQAASLIPVLSAIEQADYWLKAAGSPAALHVDTGMNRLGVSFEEAQAIAASGQPIDLVVSHLSDAALPEHPHNPRQLARFQAARALFPAARASLAASAGAFLGPDYRFDMVRPGVSLFGGGPREKPDPRLKAVARLQSPILQVRRIQAGDQIGYGSMFTAARPMRVGVLGAGYADGVIRGVYGQASAWVGAARAPILTVSMDLIAIDLEDCPDAGVGDLAELLGPSALLDDLAAAARSVPHEILVRLGRRAERVYLGDDH
jgi:alanine racemase